MFSDIPHDYFPALAGRTNPEELANQIRQVAGHPLSTAVLGALGGIVLILNPERQIIGLNHLIMESMGFADPQAMLGIRPGEAFACVHADETEEGCGTTAACPTCGGVIAILACQRHNEPTTRECVMTRMVDGEPQPFEFIARAAPLNVGDLPFTLLTLQDIRKEKRWQYYNQVFFHDQMNLLFKLQITCDAESATPGSQTEVIRQLTEQLIEDTQTQRALCNTEAGSLQPRQDWTSLSTLIGQLQQLFLDDSRAEDRRISWPALEDDVVLNTDSILVRRVLCNMLVNALEASEPGEQIRFWQETDAGAISFHVWNTAVIRPGIKARVFQRGFSSKTGVGRGLGTFSMKLLGERVLGGKVSFTSEPTAGTTFTLVLPRQLAS